MAIEADDCFISSSHHIAFDVRVQRARDVCVLFLNGSSGVGDSVKESSGWSFVFPSLIESNRVIFSGDVVV